MNKIPLRDNSKPGYVSVGIGSLGSTHLSNPNAGNGRIHPLKFPATRAVLWDHRHIGSPSQLHITHYRNLVVIVEEKTLRLVHRFSQEAGVDTFRCLLIGSLSVDPDGCGVVITVDRLETGRGSGESKRNLIDLSPSDVSIPCVVRKNCAKSCNSSEDYQHDISLLHERCTSKARLDLCHFAGLRANCSYHANNNTFIFHIDFDMVIPATEFKATPVSPVTIVPTALSKNLSGPLSMSEVQGEPKTGYLTMDHTRKVLFVLESDPKISSLPLVGIWISGVANVHDPFVWASCLRYIFNRSLQERICIPPEPFLIILYSPLHPKPEFFDCVPSNGRADLDFSLITCHEVLQLPKDCLGRAQSPLEMEMVAVEQGDKHNIFLSAMESTKPMRMSGSDNNVAVKSHLSGSLEDITPRSLPAPHLTKSPSVKPSVPEVSLLFDDQSMMFPATEPKSFPSPKTEPPSNQHPQPKLRPRLSNGPVSVMQSHPQDVRNMSPVNTAPFYQGGQMYPGNRGYGYSQFPGHYQQHMEPAQRPPGPVSSPQYYPPAQQGYPPYVGPYAQQGPMPQPRPRGVVNGPHNFHPRAPAQPMQQPNQGYGFSPQGPVPGQRPRVGPPRQPPPLHVNTGSQGYSPLRYPAQSWTQEGPYTDSVPPAYSHSQNSLPQQYQQQGLVAQYSPQTFPKHMPIPSTQSQPNPSRPITSVASNTPQMHVKTPKTSRGIPQTHIESPESLDNSPVRNSASTDSGLHSNNDSADSGGHLDQSSASASSQVPLEVYEKLRVQDEQLKSLREQLAMLLAKQAEADSDRLCNNPNSVASKSTAVPNSLPETPAKSKPQNFNQTEKCSIAINTSMWWPGQDHDHTSSQTPSRTPNILNATDLAESNIHNASNLQENSEDHLYSASNPHQQQSNFTQNISPTRTHQYPSPIQAAGGNSGMGGTLSNDTLSLEELQLTHLQDRTEESIMSEMVVDMPDYTSMSPEKMGESISGYADTEDSTCSPMLGESVSMYEQNAVEDGYSSQRQLVDNSGDEMTCNDRHFYENLINNVHKLLANSTDQEHDTTANDTNQMADMSYTTPQPNYSGNLSSLENTAIPERSINVAELTRQRLREMGVDLDKCDSTDTTTTFRNDQSYFLDPAFLPKINYMSMLFDSGDSDLSHDADALAMKYLSDEQLSALAKQRLNSPRKSRRDNGYDSVTSAGMNKTSRSDVSTFGLESNHLSFASRKYLERYGLGDARSEQNKTEKLGEIPALKNVQEHLRKLNERSFQESPHASKYEHSGHHTEHHHDQSDSRRRHLRHSTSYNSYHDNHENTTPSVYHSDGESFIVSGHRSSNSASSDITSNRIPNKSPAKLYPHRRLDEGPRISPANTPTRRNNQPKYPGESGDGQSPSTGNKQMPDLNRSYETRKGPTATKSPKRTENAIPDRVLDIERLKGLPKLL